MSATVFLRKLVQDMIPNTAEGKMMQYSALWSKNGEFIVQVGMEPVNVMKVTENNELSYLFSLFRVNPAANYYAINAESGENPVPDEPGVFQLSEHPERYIRLEESNHADEVI